LHHSPAEAPARYGVTSAFWDIAFRTNGPAPSANRRGAKATATRSDDADCIAACENEGGASFKPNAVSPHLSNLHATS